MVLPGKEKRVTAFSGNLFSSVAYSGEDMIMVSWRSTGSVG